MKVVQYAIRMSGSQYVNTSVCQYVNMSICQNATFQLRYKNESCSECLMISGSEKTAISTWYWTAKEQGTGILLYNS